MKKTPGVLALTTLILAQTVGAAAPSQAAAPVTRTKMFGEAAIAEFVLNEECKRTRVEVFANASTVSGASSVDEIGLVAVSILNTCTNFSTVEGFGQTQNIDLKLSNNLATADLKMTVPFTNFLNAETMTVTLDLQLNSTAKRVKTKARDRFESEGVVFTSSAATTVRQAEATGTVYMDTEEIVGAGDVSRTASINKAKTSDTTRERPRP